MLRFAVTSHARLGGNENFKRLRKHRQTQEWYFPFKIVSSLTGDSTFHVLIAIFMCHSSTLCAFILLRIHERKWAYIHFVDGEVDKWAGSNASDSHSIDDEKDFVYQINAVASQTKNFRIYACVMIIRAEGATLLPIVHKMCKHTTVSSILLQTNFNSFIFEDGKDNQYYISFSFSLAMLSSSCSIVHRIVSRWMDLSICWNETRN